MNGDRRKNRHRPDNNHPALCHLVPDDATTITKTDQVQDLVDLFLKKFLLNQHSPLSAFLYKDESGYFQGYVLFLMRNVQEPYQGSPSDFKNPPPMQATPAHSFGNY